jgi:hypothetical protein
VYVVGQTEKKEESWEEGNRDSRYVRQFSSEILLHY